MDRRTAALGSAVFFLVAPCVVAGLVPWLITRWDAAPGTSPALAVAGALLVVPAVWLVVSAFVRFAVDGLGTPAPIAPPKHLVVTGVYRHVRNPMYVAVVAAILGQAAILGSWPLVAYAAVVLAAFAKFVAFHEQPALRRTFGTEYDEYSANVPPWLPRLRPWTQPAED